MISQTVLEKLEFPKILQYISAYCVTEKGKAIIQTLTPSFSQPEFVTEGNLVGEAKEILIKDLYPPLIYLTDLETSLAKSKIEGTVLESKKILEILSLIISSRNFVQYLKSNSEIAPGLLKLTNDLFVDKVLEHHIQKVINENGEIKEKASAKLSDIRQEIRDKHEELIRLVNRITKSLKRKRISKRRLHNFARRQSCSSC